MIHSGPVVPPFRGQVGERATLGREGGAHELYADNDTRLETLL